MVNKLALGTVQFGLKYGINNTSGKTNETEVAEILQTAWKDGIDTLDTARGYGDSENVLGKHLSHPFKIVTKFPPDADTSAKLADSFRQSIQNLQVSSVYGFLAHNADILIRKPELWQGLLKLKESKLVEKIGYSLYTVDQLEKLIALDMIPDLVQLPYSLLDRKFEEHLSVLKKAGAEIHVRSVFLQGLYFMDIENLPKKLVPLRSNLQELQTVCKNFGIPIGALALNFVAQNSNIDKVVIGVETAQQLRENIKIARDGISNPEITDQVNAIKVEHKALLNPATW